MSEKTQNQEDAQESKNTEEGENPEKSEGQKELKSALAQKEHYREKNERTEKELEEAKKRLEELQKSLPKEEREKRAKVNASDPIDLVKTVSALKDYSSDEIEEISAYARGKGVSLSEAAQSDFVKRAIAKSREEVEAEQKIPGATRRGKSSAEEDLSSKDDKELRDNWDNIARKAVEQGKAKKRKDLGL